MSLLATIAAFVAMLLTGAIAGFFYAWSCSTMLGLDAIDPRHAIEAMQAINRLIVNPVFAPGFFGTPIALLLTSGLFFLARVRMSGVLALLAFLAYAIGAFGVTVAINVPMNQALAVAAVPEDIETARRIWQDYSPAWTAWNHLRAAASLMALLLIGLALYGAGREKGATSHNQ